MRPTFKGYPCENTYIAMLNTKFATTTVFADEAADSKAAAAEMAPLDQTCEGKYFSMT